MIEHIEEEGVEMDYNSMYGQVYYFCKDILDGLYRGTYDDHDCSEEVEEELKTMITDQFYDFCRKNPHIDMNRLNTSLESFVNNTYHHMKYEIIQEVMSLYQRGEDDIDLNRMIEKIQGYCQLLKPTVHLRSHYCEDLKSVLINEKEDNDEYHLLYSYIEHEFQKSMKENRGSQWGGNHIFDPNGEFYDVLLDQITEGLIDELKEKAQDQSQTHTIFQNNAALVDYIQKHIDYRTRYDKKALQPEYVQRVYAQDNETSESFMDKLSLLHSSDLSLYCHQELMLIEEKKHKMEMVKNYLQNVLQLSAKPHAILSYLDTVIVEECQNIKDDRLIDATMKDIDDIVTMIDENQQRYGNLILFSTQQLQQLISQHQILIYQTKENKLMGMMIIDHNLLAFMCVKKHHQNIGKQMISLLKRDFKARDYSYINIMTPANEKLLEIFKSYHFQQSYYETFLQLDIHGNTGVKTLKKKRSHYIRKALKQDMPIITSIYKNNQELIKEPIEYFKQLLEQKELYVAIFNSKIIGFIQIQENNNQGHKKERSIVVKHICVKEHHQWLGLEVIKDIIDEYKDYQNILIDSSNMSDQVKENFLSYGCINDYMQVIFEPYHLTRGLFRHLDDIKKITQLNQNECIDYLDNQQLYVLQKGKDLHVCGVALIEKEENSSLYVEKMMFETLNKLDIKMMIDSLYETIEGTTRILYVHEQTVNHLIKQYLLSRQYIHFEHYYQLTEIQKEKRKEISYHPKRTYKKYAQTKCYQMKIHVQKDVNDIIEEPLGTILTNDDYENIQENLEKTYQQRKIGDYLLSELINDDSSKMKELVELVKKKVESEVKKLRGEING